MAPKLARSRDGDDFAMVMLLQPGNDDRGVESARIGQRDSFDGCGH